MSLHLLKSHHSPTEVLLRPVPHCGPAFPARAYAGAMLARFLIWQRQTFLALRNPLFRRYWLAGLVGSTGWWIQSTAQQYIVLEISHNDAGVLGLVTMMQFLPSLLFSPFAGVLVDRLSRCMILLGTLLIEMALTLLLGVAVHLGFISIPMVLVTSFIAGTVLAFELPVKQTMVVEFVPHDDVPNAVALSSLSFNVSRTVGQSLFGAITALGMALLAGGKAQGITHLAFPYYVDVLCFVYSIAVMSTLPIKPPAPSKQGSMLAQLLEGLRYVRGHAGVLTVILLLGVLSLSTLNFSVIVPYFAKAVYHASESQFGLLSAAFGVGSIVAALWQANKPSPLSSLRLGMLLLVVIPAVLAVTPNLALAVPVYAALGFTNLLFLVSCNSVVQLSIPDELRGRVMSLYSFVFIGMSLPGALIASRVIDLKGPFGPSLGMLVLSAAAALTALLAWRWLPRELPDTPALAAD